MDSPVRTRFCLVSDSPLHIDAARIALFNWMLARQAGGQFLLRVDNIDRAIGAVDATGQILEDLRWLGLDWDEAPDVDGLREPCLQGQPAEVYEPYYRILLESGCAYHTFDTPAELEQMRQQALVAWRPFRYPRPRELPDADDVLKARQQGRPVVLRFKMPDRDITVEDLVLGSVSLPADELDDYVIRGVDGRPTWLFTTVIDDQRMGITHVIRGQEHLPYAHRHVALQEALGFRQPAYAHLPLILDPDGSVLSRHDKERDLRADRAPRPHRPSRLSGGGLPAGGADGLPGLRGRIWRAAGEGALHAKNSSGHSISSGSAGRLRGSIGRGCCPGTLRRSPKQGRSGCWRGCGTTCR